MHVDLLQADHLGSCRLDRGCDALEVEHVVEPDAMVDVERRHAQRAWRWGAGNTCRRAGAGNDGGDERQEKQDGGGDTAAAVGSHGIGSS